MPPAAHWGRDSPCPADLRAQLGARLGTPGPAEPKLHLLPPPPGGRQGSSPAPAAQGCSVDRLRVCSPGRARVGAGALYKDPDTPAGWAPRAGVGGQLPAPRGAGVIRVGSVSGHGHGQKWEGVRAVCRRWGAGPALQSQLTFNQSHLPNALSLCQARLQRGPCRHGAPGSVGQVCNHERCPGRRLRAMGSGRGR